MSSNGSGSGTADGLRVPWSVVWGASVVAAAALGYALGGARDAPPAAAATAAVATAATDTRTAPPAAPTGPATLPVKPTGGTAPAMPTRMQPMDPQEAARRTAQMQADLEAEFRREPEVAAWAAAAEADLVQAASSDDAVATGETPTGFIAECRAKTCKVTATFTEDGDAESWAGGFLLGAGGRRLGVARVMTRRLPDGRVELVIYGTGD